jgi:hypothetical protein
VRSHYTLDHLTNRWRAGRLSRMLPRFINARMRVANLGRSLMRSFAGWRAGRRGDAFQKRQSSVCDSLCDSYPDGILDSLSKPEI